MKVRENSKIKRNSAEYEVIKRQALDLYVITQNATECYNLFRRAVDGEEFAVSSNRSTASNFFKREEHIAYMDNKRAELSRQFFEHYARENDIDISELETIQDKYGDLENITPDELRTKNLSELEDLKRKTTDDVLKANIIKQQTDLMDAKRREIDTKKTDEYIHYYLPTPYCNECPRKHEIQPIITEEENEE